MQMPVVWALLLASGCTRGAEDSSRPGEAGPKPPPVTAAPVAPDPELDALGLKVFGPHEHRGKHPEPHYRMEAGRDWLGEKEEPPSPEKLEGLRKMPGIVSVEVKEGVLPYTKTPGKYLLITKLIDLWAEADEKAWQREMAERYLVQGSIGRYKSPWPGSAARELPGSGLPDTVRVDLGCAHLTMLMAGSGGGPFYADVFVCEKDPALLDHEFEREVLRHGGGIRSEGGQLVVKYVPRNEGGQGAFWSTGTGVYVSVVAERYPREVIAAYLKKHPSRLKKDYAVDAGKWAGAEFANRFRWMNDALSLPDARQACQSFSEQCHHLRKYFPVPVENRERRTPDECRQDRKLIGDWWEANLARLRWNQKAWKFEVKE
jgi:hypothetical protein